MKLNYYGWGWLEDSNGNMYRIEGEMAHHYRLIVKNRQGGSLSIKGLLDQKTAYDLAEKMADEICKAQVICL